jgi:hypothetical protein
MINPFSEKQVREGVISYGLSSYGYDLRVADEFKIFTNVNCTVVDPKNFDERSFVTMRSDVCIVASGAHLRQRRTLRNQLRRPQGQIPVAERDCAAQIVGRRKGNWFESAVEENVET